MAFTKSKRDVVANIDRNLWRKFLDILQPIPHNHFNQAYEKLDTFYLYTLRQTKDPIAAHRLLAFCVFLTSIRVRERTTHEDFVDFCESFLALPSSIDILLSDLSSIMHQDMDVILDQDGPCRRFAHLGQEHLDIPVSRIFHYESFVAFLLDHRRAKEFYIDVEEFDRIFYELAMEGISVPRYLRLAPGDPYKKRSKVIYCFAILLQSETATTEWEAGEVVEALQKWDSFDENMLYDVMELVLSGKSGDNTVESRFLTLLESTPAVRHIFVAALKRKRVQYHNSLASSNLPAEFFAFFRGVDESMLAFPLSVTPEKVDLTLLMVVHIHHSCKKLLQWDMWGFLQHHPLQSSSWFTIARILADCQVKHEGGSEQLEYEDLDWGSVICEVSAAVLYYIKQIIALFDPSPDITRPQEVLDAFGYLEGTIGPHWREIAALELLRYIQSSLWSECHISDEIVSALKELSDCLFPPDIVSTLENTALSSLPIYSSKHKTSSAFLDSPCALPRWYLGGFDEQAVFEPDMENNLGSIHDYVRLYDIYNNPASGDRDTTGSGSDRGTNKTDGIEADVLVSETKDPHAGGHIDYVSWSFDSRIARYKNSLRMQVARSQEEEQEQEES
ncbi:hypothetical protein BJ165DRAFT_1483218 [Panaeolus papilionaceus]|nr:hypothetical protein BJ165DRAFT_1483218 [Panaeolus papilionaceus]